MRHGIFWIASYPRSGNTWVRAFLGALQDVIAGRPPTASRLIGVSERTFDRGEFSSANLRKRLGQQMAYARQHPGVSFAKTHSARVIVDGLPTIVPDATLGAVYLVRDPRDVAISYARMFNLEMDAVIEGLALRGWVSGPNEVEGFEVVGSWSENVRSWGRQSDTLVIRYEDLQAAPAKYFADLAGRVGWQPTLIQLTTAAAAVSFDRMQAAEKADPVAMEGIRISHGVAGRWQAVLSAAQAEKIERDHRELMIEFGYL